MKNKVNVATLVGYKKSKNEDFEDEEEGEIDDSELLEEESGEENNEENGEESDEQKNKGYNNKENGKNINEEGKEIKYLYTTFSKNKGKNFKMGFEENKRLFNLDRKLVYAVNSFNE